MLSFRTVLVPSVTRRLFSTASAEGTPPVTLYQYAICPFCSKSKAIISYANVPFKAVEVNPLTKAEIEWSRDYRKVPIASLDNEVVWKGSDEIADGLLSQGFVQKNLEAKWSGKDMTMEHFRNDDGWVSFTNEKLAALMYPNICRTLSDSYLAFGYVNSVDSFTWFQKQSIRALGSLAMNIAASKVKKRLNVTNEQAALDKELDTIEEALKSNEFLSGREEPHLGDLAVFGALRSVEGLPAHDRILGDTDRPLRKWYDRVRSRMSNEWK